MNTVFLIIFLLLINYNTSLSSRIHTKHILKKKHITKPLPKKLAQHAPYYAYKNAIQHKISYHQAYDSLYKKW
jgi:hypothetical protein